MSGVNKVILVGRLGSDPELKYTTNSQAVAKFSVATSEQWKNKQTGDMQEKTEWHRIVVWGKMAEICGQHLAKGRQVYIEGKLATRSWEDQASGQKKYSTEVIAQTVQFLGAPGEKSQILELEAVEKHKLLAALVITMLKSLGTNLLLIQMKKFRFNI